ncbi:hypothetical protein PGT21_024318 [Puccinia graminis f. sp. tritici]|uniref:Uncharacterized protein n=1 Tax=Puccinia graminis f. sp. tritici TaxID=56615 RepID=A0A5B0NSS8_PUCGR|nr:hypothetical protein PGT21_024318 [Puccinia graminis f. sp. tritici]KAA1092295.1 hypothetical protein PGTUg99_015421 [Puccinia graminis f. sp. tritici]
MADNLPDLQELAAALPVPPAIEKNIQELEKLLSGFVDDDVDNFEHWYKIKDLAHEVANLLRDLRFRQSVGSETKIFPYIINTINKVIAKRSTVKVTEMHCPIMAVTQLLRIIGNLVHTSDDNRHKCLDAGGAPAIKSIIDMFVDMALVDQTCYEEEIRISLIVATNFSVDFQPAQDLLSELGLTASLSRLIEYAYAKRLVWMSFPLILLDEMTGIETGWKQIPDSLLCTLAQMIIYYSVQDDDADYPNPPKEENLNVQIVMLCSTILQTLVEHAGPGRFTSWIFAPADPVMNSFSDDGPPTPMWLRLAMFLRSAHHGIEAAPGTYQGPKKYNLYSMIKALIIQALVLTMAHVQVTPACRLTMYGVLAQWVQEDTILKKRPDLVIMSGLWLSNLACDEEACRVLVEEFKILESLVNVFKIWSPSRLGIPDDSTLCKAEPGQQAQILHGWCGLARNLAVPAAYKAKLGELGMIDYALECLRPEFDIVEPLNATAAALLRHLCRNNSENVVRVLESERVDYIINLAKRAEQPYFILETSRLLSALINTAAQMDLQSNNSASGWEVLYSEKTVEVIVRFAYFTVASQHFILMNEALMSLAFLAVRPSLVHSLCRNLLKLQDGGEPVAPVADSGDDEQVDKEEKWRMTIHVLLCLTIPNEPKATQNGQEPTDGQAKEGDKAAKSEESEDEEELPEEVKKLIKQIPMQMKQNLFVALAQLGDVVMKTPRDSQAEDPENGRSDVERIQDILLKHYQTHLSQEPPASESTEPMEEISSDAVKKDGPPHPVSFSDVLKTWNIKIA